MSYTSFDFKNLRLSKLKIQPNENVKVSVEVTNTGKVAGDEVVQLYTHDIAATVTRPVRELRGFQRIGLKAKETKTVEFTLTPEDLKFYDREMKKNIEPGKFQIIVGQSSDGGLQSTLEVSR